MMLTDFREIVREVSAAPNLDEMLTTMVRRVNDTLPIDVCILENPHCDRYRSGAFARLPLERVAHSSGSFL